MFSLFSNILNYFFINFYAQVTPAYDAASKHLSSKGIQGQDLLVFIIFGIIAGIFIIFLIFFIILFTPGAFASGCRNSTSRWTMFLSAFF